MVKNNLSVDGERFFFYKQTFDIIFLTQLFENIELLLKSCRNHISPVAKPKAGGIVIQILKLHFRFVELRVTLKNLFCLRFFDPTFL